MRFSRDQLVLQALAALSEIADSCGERPAAPTLILRFTLAFLYAESGGDPAAKWLFDSFWRSATVPAATAAHDRFLDSYCRGSGARSALNGICRALGHEPTPSFDAQLAGYRPQAGDAAP